MSNKIFKAINSYKSIKGMDIGWYDILMKSLSNNTITMIENGGMDLDSLSDVINLTMSKAVDESMIERELLKNYNDKL